MQFTSADQCKHKPYETEHAGHRSFGKEEQMQARYTGVYLPGEGDIKRMQSVNAARQKKGLPPLKSLGF